MQKLNLRIVNYLSITLLLCGTLIKIYSQNIHINEFMALNNITLTDEDGDYSDWLEIYNPTDSSVNLHGWSLTDDPADSNKWIFPDTIINKEEYLIIFASGKDRAISGKKLHANFKLSGGGEYLALIDTTGTIITEFSPNFPPQQDDYSFGFLDGTWIEFSDPTPGDDNNLSVGTVIPTPVFNVKHGFFNSPFNLEIQSSISNTEIYYTTDGSTPTSKNGSLYSSPINISTTSIIRAVAISEGKPPSKTVTQTYIFTSDVIHQTNTPSGYPDKWGPYSRISGNATADYEMDPDMVADADFAEDLKTSLLSIPTMSLVTDKDYFFSHSTDPDSGGIYIYTGAPTSNTTYALGRGWERPVSLEFFDNDSASLQINCGISLHGGHGRLPEKSPKHNFVLKFKSEYGPSRLNYALFGEEGSGDYNKLVLRAEFCNSWTHHSHDQRVISTYQRDIWTKDAQRNMGHPSSNSIYVHLYINGMYWGIYAPAERMDADYGEKYMGGDSEDWDVIKDQYEVADGNWDAWNQMMAMANAGLSGHEAYMQIQGKLPDGKPDPANNALLDVVNLADYMLLNFYGNNTDWDHHNWAAMRNRVDPGSGFKFFSWDAEHMIKDINGDNLDENNDKCPSRVFTKLKANEDFVRLFADRVYKHCFNNGTLTPETAKSLWIERKNEVEPAIISESARWGDYRRDVHQYQTSGPFHLYTYEDHYLPHQNFMLNSYFPSRTDIFLEKLRNEGLYPEVDAPEISLNGNAEFSPIITEGDLLSMSATEGTIYYTTNGTDPVVWHSTGDEGIKLIENSSDKRVFVPKSDIGDTWYTDNNFDDSEWELCSGAPGGVGYDKESDYNDIFSLDVSNDMYEDGSDPNTSCYIRIAFDVSESDLSKFTSLMLSINYDDGFFVYLNGTKVAQKNSFGAVSWNSKALYQHDGSIAEYIDITDYIDQLVAGENVLAIHGLNNNISNPSFLINVALTATDEPEGIHISDDALIYSSAISLEQSSHIVARAFHDEEWSAANSNYFIIPEDYSDLKVTEIHYNPLPKDTIDGDQFEFIEIKNTGLSTLYLGGIEFTDGIEYKFPSETQLSPSEFIVLASDKYYFTMRYGFLPTDEYKGNLNNSGERLIMQDMFMDTIINIRYNDNQDWPQEADGDGKSLVPVDSIPANNQNNPAEWKVSYNIGGSPGLDDIFGMEPVEPVEPTDTIVPVEPTDTIAPTDTLEPLLTNYNQEKEFILAQNYPNPFSSITYIDYRLPEDAMVQISVYNVMGQMITTLVNKHHFSGHYQVSWDGNDMAGNNVPNGMYIYMINIENRNKVKIHKRMMMLVR